MDKDIRRTAMMAYQAGIPFGSNIMDFDTGKFSGPLPTMPKIDTYEDIPELVKVGERVEVRGKPAYVKERLTPGKFLVHFDDGSERTVSFDELARQPQSLQRLAPTVNSYENRIAKEAEFRATLEKFWKKELPGEELTDDDLVFILLAAGHAPVEEISSMHEIDGVTANIPGALPGHGERLDPETGEQLPPSIRTMFYMPSDEGIKGEEWQIHEGKKIYKDELQDWTTVKSWGKGGPIGGVIKAFKLLGEMTKLPISFETGYAPGETRGWKLGIGGPGGLGVGLDLDLGQRAEAAGEALHMATEPLWALDRSTGLMVASVIKDLPFNPPGEVLGPPFMVASALGADVPGLKEIVETSGTTEIRNVRDADIEHEKGLHKSNVEALGVFATLLMPGVGIGPKGVATGLKLPFRAAGWAGRKVIPKMAAKEAARTFDDALSMSKVWREVPPELPFAEAPGAERVAGQVEGVAQWVSRKPRASGATRGWAIDLGQAKKLIGGKDGYAERITNKAARARFVRRVEDLEDYVSGVERGFFRNYLASQALLPEVTAAMNRMVDISHARAPRVLSNMVSLQRDVNKLYKEGIDFTPSMVDELSEVMPVAEAARSAGVILKPVGQTRSLLGFFQETGRIISKGVRSDKASIVSKTAKRDEYAKDAAKFRKELRAMEKGAPARSGARLIEKMKLLVEDPTVSLLDLRAQLKIVGVSDDVLKNGDRNAILNSLEALLNVERRGEGKWAGGITKEAQVLRRDLTGAIAGEREISEEIATLEARLASEASDVEKVRDGMNSLNLVTPDGQTIIVKSADPSEFVVQIGEKTFKVKPDGMKTIEARARQVAAEYADEALTAESLASKTFSSKGIDALRRTIASADRDIKFLERAGLALRDRDYLSPGQVERLAEIFPNEPIREFAARLKTGALPGTRGGVGPLPELMAAKASNLQVAMDGTKAQLAAARKEATMLARANAPEALKMARGELNDLIEEFKKNADSVLAMTNPRLAKQTYSNVPVVQADGSVKVVRKRSYVLRDQEAGIYGIPSDQLTTRTAEQINFINATEELLRRPPPMSKKAADQHFKDMRVLTGNFIDQVGLMEEAHLPLSRKFIDQMMLSFDPQRDLLSSMAKTSIDYMDKMTVGPSGLFKKAGFLRRISGQVLDPPMQAAFRIAENLRTAAEFRIQMSVGSYMTALRRFATDYRLPDGSKLPGRSSLQRAENLLRRGFDRGAFIKFATKLDKNGKPYLNNLVKNDKGQWIVPEDVVDTFASDVFAFVLNHEKGWWKKGASDIPEGVFQMTKAARQSYEDTRAGMRLVGMRSKSESIFQYMLEPSIRGVDVTGDDTIQILLDLRKHLDELSTKQRLTFGLLAGRAAGPEDVLNLRHVPEAIKGIPLRRALRSGEDQLGGVMATMHRRIINRQMFQSLFDKYGDKNMVSRVTELFHFDAMGHGVSVTKAGAIKDPAMREQIKMFADLMSGTGGKGFGGFTAMIGRNLAMGRLIADMSILGVQSSMFFALNPAKIPGAAMHALRVMDDENYYAWLLGNSDELGLYMRKGLRVGMAAFLGGEFQPSWWLEHLPIAGGFARGVTQFNDIQFTRWLLYMKTEAIRTHMHTWNMINKSTHQLGPFVREGKGTSLVNEELGGKYLTASRDDTLEAVIRVVNNQLGGLPRHQYGAGAVREASERLFAIVPGFFRARAGLVVQSLNKPHTAEGLLAQSVIARELMWSAGISAGLSFMFGEGDRWMKEAQDPRSSRWLSVALADSNINLIPSPSALRTMVRALGGYSDIKSPEQRFRAFLGASQGRMSPMVSALYNIYQKEDYLGRTYSDNWDAIINESLTLTPIFMEQIIEGWSDAQGDPKKLATMAITEFMGRTWYPQRAMEQLDEFTEKVIPGWGWQALSPEMKDVVRASYPEQVAKLEDRADAEWTEKQTEVERNKTQAFDLMGQIPEMAYDTVLHVNGVPMSQAEADHLALTGVMPWPEWMERFNAYQAHERGMYDDAERNINEIYGGKSMDEVREEKLEELKEGAAPDVFIAMRELKLINPEDFTNQELVMGPDGRNVAIDVIDYDAMDKAKTTYLSRYSDDVQQEVKARLDAKLKPAERMFRRAQDDLDEYMDLNKYRQLNEDQGEMVDRYRQLMGQTIDTLRSMGVDAEAASGRNVRATFVKALVLQGLIATQEQASLAAIAYEMESNNDFAKLMENPQRAAYVLTHPNMVQFFDWLASDVPRRLTPALPSGVRPEIDLGILRGEQF